MLKRNFILGRLTCNTNSLPTLGKGTYLLILYLSSIREIRIGKLGVVVFRKGYYVYIGSAFGPGGLTARLRHHLRISPHPHWHIDYLRQYASVQAIRVCEDPSTLEHQWADCLKTMEGAIIPAPGFGSSDCTCETHLFYFRRKMDLFGPGRRL